MEASKAIKNRGEARLCCRFSGFPVAQSGAIRDVESYIYIYKCIHLITIYICYYIESFMVNAYTVNEFGNALES